MAETVDPEFTRFVEAERRAKRLPRASRTSAEGEVFEPVSIRSAQVTGMVRVAARRAAGFFRATERTEVVWVQGENELAVGFGAVDVKLSAGQVRLVIPVRCDQTGRAAVEVLFVVGSPDQPAGLYAATSRRPNGPQVIVAAWGEAL
ncbi:hypothetical protein ACQUZK_08800, partial [Streptococcus pyogenes]|uniref:hypothetical protein n=1 Tax=Streptococcus pyogenes TaxID=1314 RepID=UPI003DA08F3F